MSAEVSTTDAPNRKPPSFPRALLGKALLLLFGTVLALLLLEVLLHFYNPLQVRIKGNRIVLTTNKTYRINNDIIKGLDPQITVTRNSIGFRGPNPPSDMDKYLSVVTIGGSTTQCFFLSDDQTWTARLGKDLERSFNPVWINNAGLDGHSTHGHLVLLEDFIVGLHPQVAVFLVGANDVARAKISDWDSENVKSGVQFGSPKAFIKSLSAYSEVVALLLNGYRSYTAYKAGLIHQQIDLKSQGYLDIPESEQKQNFEENANAEFLKGYEERLTKIIEVCKKAGIEPVFVTQPLLAGFGTDDVTGIDLARVKAYGPRQTGKMYWDVVEAYNDITRKVGRANGVLVIDLAKEMPKSSRYFYDFIHYTPEGARQIGDILDKSLCPVLQSKFARYATHPCFSMK
ncbi:MAG: SGNH/GDSL hydrolase family protein [Pyrinomonadaceae bacterium]